MRNSLKVAKWELKRNLKNKTFVIGLFLTPVIIIGFMIFGTLFGDSDESHEEELTHVFVNDQLGVFPQLQETIKQVGFNWELQETNLEQSEVEKKLEDREHTAYIFVQEQVLEQGNIPVYTSDEINPFFMNQVQVLESPLQAMQMAQLGFSEEEMAIVSQRFNFEDVRAESTPSTEESEAADEASSEDLLERIVPGAFAGFIMLSIVFTGMAIFQSASQEKKDKIAEIILSSLTPGELMQGKIFGYFILGLIQSVVSIAIVLPVLLWRIDVPVLEYLLVPDVILLVMIAILGYLLFAAVFVGVGATMADMTTAGNFQGMVMMLPFLPFIFISPVLSDPNGLMAQIGTYIPFTSPGVLLLRLSMLEEWPWVEIFISLAILVVSIWVFMKMAGKIFKVGILMYGKNATPKEIWRWLRA
ncbi:ABC transporter permease [Salinibacillus xinjiangensis]|uniref:ABC transporter permease subunit n=1 Tax=Salinibacillus xinjiangensis TaxID=1229268 RepID=A0A6G1X7X5_9BACI|nr:ABC transporter permease [Salinibacillus xinjiangensis]MRG87042.1 ABC transporter permease subunit [Salinibacillus xinjiangensis]